ncbi:MAG: GTPase ObgE [Bacilli bacterium]|nr:GTPase ObgE [Bacilli bacterium]MDY6430642.1 GTPase ObgE [Bacilli bacterium]
MLIDRCVVEVRSGKGGDGAISFLREKNMPKGGPDGGNGGRGGSIYLVAKKNLNTLLSFRHSRVIEASDGENGDKKLRFGANAEDVYVDVPVGTIIYEEENNIFIADLKHEGDTCLVAKGGRGGRGNAAFKSSRNRIPRIAENGRAGVTKRIILELKIVADAGLIGFPSVGKSTLLNIVSKANVPTADYPFTTLSPNLGVVTLDDGYTHFVLADMPGLIEGASEGKGLGITFLRHIERCKVLVHCVSMEEGRDPYDDYLIIRKELEKYGKDLLERPFLVVSTKMDEEGAEERKAAFDKKLGFESIGISALTNENVSYLMKKIYEIVSKTPEIEMKAEESEEGGIRIYDASKDDQIIDFEITHPSAHLFVIEGKKVIEKYRSINLSTREGIEQLITYLSKIGVDDALREAGAQNGDSVMLSDFEFDYYE